MSWCRTLDGMDGHTAYILPNFFSGISFFTFILFYFYFYLLFTYSHMYPILLAILLISPFFFFLFVVCPLFKTSFFGQSCGYTISYSILFRFFPFFLSWFYLFSISLHPELASGSVDLVTVKREEGGCMCVCVGVSLCQFSAGDISDRGMVRLGLVNRNMNSSTQKMNRMSI